MSSFKGENMKTQHIVLNYFHDYKLAIEIDENGQYNKSNRTRAWLF